jgi:hypothetical protein
VASQQTTLRPTTNCHTVSDLREARLQINKADIDKELDLEKADNSGDVSRVSSCKSSDRSHAIVDKSESDGQTVLSFGHNDPSNPRCFSQSKKIYVVVSGILLVMNSTIGSTIASGVSEPTARHFDITSETQLVLPASMYLLGYVLGPLAFSPLSETYGRKLVMFWTFALYTVFTLGCALAPTWAGLIIMRFLVGVGASTPISVIGGIYADMVRKFMVTTVI